MLVMMVLMRMMMMMMMIFIMIIMSQSAVSDKPLSVQARAVPDINRGHSDGNDAARYAAAQAIVARNTGMETANVFAQWKHVEN